MIITSQSGQREIFQQTLTQLILTRNEIAAKQTEQPTDLTGRHVEMENKVSLRGGGQRSCFSKCTDSLESVFNIKSCFTTKKNLMVK